MKRPRKSEKRRRSLRDCSRMFVLTFCSQRMKIFSVDQQPRPEPRQSSIRKLLSRRRHATRPTSSFRRRGPFTFDLETNVAKFENSVQVLRRNPPEHKEGKDSIDQLEADILTLQFKEGAVEGNAEATRSDKEKGLSIERAIATGTQVILLSESQKLHATGNRLEFDASTHVINLQGDQEMIAVKDNAVIHAQKFRLHQDDTGKSRLPKQIEADGPHGWMDLIEAEGGQVEKDGEKSTNLPLGGRLRINWQDKLVMTKRLIPKPMNLSLPAVWSLNTKTRR